MTQILKLLQSVTWSYFALVNVLFLYLLSLFIFSLLGCYLYKDLSYQKNKKLFSSVTDYYNFDSFYNAFSLILLSWFDNYEVFMLEYMYADTVKIQPLSTVIFFISYYFFCFIIMLNLFLLVIIMQYDEFYEKKFNPIEKFENMSRVFKKYWVKYIDEDGSPFRIKSNKFKTFLESFEKNASKENLPRRELVVSTKKIFIFNLRLLE